MDMTRLASLATTFNHLTRELEEAQLMTEGERKKAFFCHCLYDRWRHRHESKRCDYSIKQPALELLNVSRETAFRDADYFLTRS